MQDELHTRIQKLDPKKVFDSIELFSTQCESVWQKSTIAITPKNNIQNILLAGMGGSALGAYILQSLDAFAVPITISHDYKIPTWVNEHTLVIAVSYSGGTEETLSATKIAIEKNAQLVCITVGGELEKIASEKSLDLRKIDPTQNPCGQPRFGVGFMLFEILRVCTDYKLYNISTSAIELAVKELSAWQTNFKNSKIIDAIYAQAQTLADKIPVIVSAEHLAGVTRFTRNQIHETGKTFVLAHELPELNHHLMEGLEFPHDNPEKVFFVFFESELYTDKIKKRIAITKDVLTKQGIHHTSIAEKGGSPLGQALIAMLYSMYLAYSLSMVHEKDPSDIKWVDYFKEQLGK